MGKPNGTAALYALSLRRAMERREMTVRGLGKATDPDEPERGRRRGQRHLSGKYMPTSAIRSVYADVLDAPELLPDDEDEESSDVTAVLMRELRATRRRMDRLVREVAR